MMKGKIVFATSIDSEGDGTFDNTFDVTISKGRIETHTHLYLDSNLWQEFGRQLLTFPENTTAKVVFDATDNGMYWQSLRLEAYCFDLLGHTALRISVDNNDPDPHRCRLEFSIPAEAASLNKLGRLLANWQPEHESEIIWEAQVS